MNCKCCQTRRSNCLKKGLNEQAKSFQKLKNTLLHHSVRYGNAETTRLLINEGCDVNSQDNFGVTPLILAVKTEDLKTVKLLMKTNADIYITDHRGKSSLQLAVDRFNPLRNDSHFILEIFFDIVNDDFLKGSSKQFLSNASKRTKFASLVFGNAEIVSFVLESGYSVDSREHQNRCTALHCAILLGRFENAKVLIALGANVDLVDKFRWSTLSRYTFKFEDVDENSELLKIILRLSTSLSRPQKIGSSTDLGNLLMLGKKKTVKTVLLSGVDVDECIGEDESLLSLLILNRNIGILDLLAELDVAFDVNYSTSYGRTALMTAASFGWVDKVEFLLQHGANVNSTDYVGYSALSHTQINNKNSDEERNMAKVIELLLQHGADVQCFYVDRPFLLDCEFLLSSKIIVAHLAMLGAAEPPLLSDSNRDSIQSEQRHKNYFDLCTEQLEDMKNFKVNGTMTLFKLLSESEEKILTYVRNKALISAWSSALDNSSHLEAYYFNILQRKFARLSDEAKLQAEAALAIEALTGLCSDVFNVIVYKIICDLDHQDLHNLCEIMTAFDEVID